MRLISKFHDYYDTAIGYGIDPNVVFDRKTVKHKNLSRQRVQNGQTAELEKLDTLLTGIPKPFGFSSGKVEKYVYPFSVYFCGKRYNGMVTKDKYIRYLHEENDHYTYNKKEMLSICVKTNSFRQGEFIEFVNQKQVDTTDLHFSFDAPIMYADSNNVTINPVLQDIEFFKVIDPYTAFQELSMYISGVMGGQSPSLVQLTDKDLVAKHGFHDMSFRKRKG